MCVVTVGRIVLYWSKSGNTSTRKWGITKVMYHKDGVTKPCLGCGEMFTASPKRVFCQSKCRDKFYRKYKLLVRVREPEVAKVNITLDWVR